MRREDEGVNFERALGALRRRALWIILCTTLGAGSAFAFSTQQSEQYTATASLVFSGSQLNEQLAGLQPAASTDAQIQQATNLELVQLGDAAKTAETLDHGLTEEKVDDSLNVSAPGTANVVNISATLNSARLAAATANTYSEQFVETQRRANKRDILSALAIVRRQLRALTPKQRASPAGLNLEDRAQSLEILANIHSGGVRLARRATVPTSPSSPEVAKITIVGAMLGLLVGLGVAFLLEHLDRQIKEPEDLEAIYGLPLLGSIPESDAIARFALRGGEMPDMLRPGEVEAFRMIRAQLRYFTVDRRIRTLLVASAAPGDGKTTLAYRLAEADAVLGKGTPLLIEADLRAPMLAQRLGIDPGPGLAQILAGDVSLARAIQSISVGPPSSRRRLDVLVAGFGPPPNPGGLLESRAMNWLLEHAGQFYEFVTIDTPPLTAVSDAFPLLESVHGVILVGRLGRLRRDVAYQLRTALAGTAAPLLGVVANGVKPGSLTPYPYGYDEIALRTPTDREQSERGHIHAESTTGAHDE